MEKGLTVDRQSEIDRNLEFFLQELPNLPSSLQGKYALLRHQKIVDFYDTLVDALKVANSNYSDKLFSVQEVANTVADLGYYSHAMHLGVSQ